MSFLALHMDKFKKEAVRGIQSHNRRERESHTNPDIDYGRSAGNFDLHEPAAESYAEAIQSRIDDLLLVKAVRKDAVHMCGLVVTSDSAFFQSLSPEDTRRFFEESKAFLTEFVGEKNVVSAMVHLDEKTPHMHFLHVPVTPDGRLNANKIYTRESLKALQTELPRYLQSKGFDLQRGIEQAPGAAKKHLDTREYKQQQEAVHALQREEEAIKAALEQGRQEESVLKERLQSYERQAREAEKVLRAASGIPEASMFNYKAALEKAKRIIEQQRKILAIQSAVTAQKERLEVEVGELTKRAAYFEAAYAHEQKHGMDAVGKILKQYDQTSAALEEYRNFANQPEIHQLHIAYLQERREFARKKEAERKALERERQEAQQRKEEQERQQAELAKEQERQREQENQKARELAWGRRGMGMGR